MAWSRMRANLPGSAHEARSGGALPRRRGAYQRLAEDAGGRRRRDDRDQPPARDEQQASPCSARAETRWTRRSRRPPSSRSRSRPRTASEAMRSRSSGTTGGSTGSTGPAALLGCSTRFASTKRARAPSPSRAPFAPGAISRSASDGSASTGRSHARPISRRTASPARHGSPTSGPERPEPRSHPRGREEDS